MNFETAYYIIHHFPRLLTSNEKTALRHHNAISNIGPPEMYSSIDSYNEKIERSKKHNRITNDPDSLALLENGIESFYIGAASRSVEQYPEKVFLNNCPNCGYLARTPYARQCKNCGHNWHSTIAANFLVNKILSLNQRRNTLFFAGIIKSGEILQGMKIDLTFMGVAIKPIIKAIEFIDNISEKRHEIALAVTIDQADDFEYLKNGPVLAIPIIIEY